MTKHKVTIFKPYPFQVGQKIRIEGSTREAIGRLLTLPSARSLCAVHYPIRNIHGICSAILRKRRMMLHGPWSKLI